MARRKLQGKTIVITGGGGGLGAAIAQEFSYSGGNVALLDISYGDAVVAADKIQQGVAVPIECDVTDVTSCDAAMAQVDEQLGPVDVLVNNAGISHRSAFATTEVNVLRHVMDVNFWGAVHCTKAVLPTVISSIAGYAPLLGRTGYAASKHALHGMFGSLRTELRGTGVDVLIAAPSFVDTPLRDRTLDGDGSVTTHPQSRVGTMMSPEDAAERIVWAVERRKQTLVVGNVGRASRYLSAIAPATYERLMARSLQSELDR